jgi:SAM-dependent methyltransferase
LDWRIKGVIQKVLAHLPAGQRLNSLLQQRGGEDSLHSQIDSKVLDDWLVHVDHLRALAPPLSGRTYLEIGTGWYPTFPTCFSLLGADRCLTYDLYRLLDFRLTQLMAARLSAHLGTIAQRTGVAEHDLRERLTTITEATDVDDFLQRARIEYHAPADASATTLPARSVDIVFSNSVLEHVTGDTLDALMRETRRLLKPGGLAIHSVNCGDHYAYFDRRITQINYLRYTDSQWRLWNNDLQYQNRLRADDFIASAKRAGLKIVLNVQRPRPELLASIASMTIAPEFRRYSPEQLCTTSVTFAAMI